MQEQSFETHEDIHDCGSLQLAVKVGIAGILIQFISTLVITALIFNFHDTPGYNLASLNYQLIVIEFLSISWIMFVSMGYAGIFVMKRNRIAFLFPSLALISTAGFMIYRWILWEFIPDSGELLATSQIVLVNTALVITSLALLTIRKKTVNTKLLYSLVVVMLTNVFLIGLIQSLLFGYIFPIDGGIEFLISDLPRLVVKFLISCLIIAFFITESKAGCQEYGKHAPDTQL